MAALAVEIHEAADEFVFAGGGAAGAQAGLDRGRAAVVELVAFQVAGQALRHLLQQPDFDFGREVMGIHQQPGVLGDRLRDFRVAVAERRYIDAAGEVDEFVAVDILQDASRPFGEGHGKQLHLAGQAAVMLGGTLVQLIAARAGNRVRDQAGIEVQIQLIGGRVVLAHDVLLK